MGYTAQNKAPAFHQDVGAYSFWQIGNLAHQEIPHCNKGNTCNHTDGHIPGECPDIATLQHYQRLFGEGGEGSKTATETNDKEQRPVAAFRVIFAE